MRELEVVDAQTLLFSPLEKPKFLIDGLIPTGLSLFCGSQKIGKSWLMLRICLQVSKGLPLWDIPTTQSEVLYLCLEDPYSRIQERLFKLTDEADSNLHFAKSSNKLADGLVAQLDGFMKKYPHTKLIVVDTLQKVRPDGKDSSYANDYGDISQLKAFADKYAIAVIAVHHIRKQGDSDVFNKVSGTTGLTGCADASFVLDMDFRGAETGKLYAVGRDIEYQELSLKFKDCEWQLIERKKQEQIVRDAVPPVIFRLVSFMQKNLEWRGSATELLAAIDENEITPNVITKLLNEYHASFLSENHICYSYVRKNIGRQIVLTRGDSSDSDDSNFGTAKNCWQADTVTP